MESPTCVDRLREVIEGLIQEESSQRREWKTPTSGPGWIESTPLEEVERHRQNHQRLRSEFETIQTDCLKAGQPFGSVTELAEALSVLGANVQNLPGWRDVADRISYEEDADVRSDLSRLAEQTLQAAITELRGALRHGHLLRLARNIDLQPLNSYEPSVRERLDWVEGDAEKLLKSAAKRCRVAKFDRQREQFVAPPYGDTRQWFEQTCELMSTIWSWPGLLTGIFVENGIAKDEAQRAVEGLIASYRELFNRGSKAIAEDEFESLVGRCGETLSEFHRLADFVRGRLSAREAPQAKIVMQMDSPTAFEPKGTAQESGAKPAAAPNGLAVSNTNPRKVLKDCELQVYYAHRYAELKMNEELEAPESYRYWCEHGFDPNDTDMDHAELLRDFDPTTKEQSSYASQLTRARRHPDINEPRNAVRRNNQKGQKRRNGRKMDDDGK